MFRSLFKEPENALSLCNAVHQTDITDPNDVQIYNLDETVVSPYRQLNDLCVLVGSSLLYICEHQSTSDKWLPWRALEYYVLIVRRKLGIDLGKASVKLPRPLFCEIYLGSETAEAVQVLEMESLYYPGPETYVNPHVMRYNIINKECPILSACASLAGYAEFMRKVREARKAKATRLDAVRYAIDYCIEHDLI
ncbi:MAG: hypothetical protein IJ228_00780, partial [Succinivibrio sp.]|nr:hypothetical protein [Succinivibrio sp.]